MLSRRRLVVNGNNIFSNYGFLKDLGNFASVILTNLRFGFQMYKRLWILSFVFLALLLAVAGVDAYARYRFRSFDVADGLADNSVRCIGQDNDGYIWIGTRNGLSRFDGSAFVNYRYMPGNPAYEASNDINSLLTDGDSIWIGSARGLLVFDRRSSEFSQCSIASTGKGRRAAFRQPVKGMIKVGGVVYVLGRDRRIYRRSGGIMYEEICAGEGEWYSFCPYYDKYILAHGRDGLCLIDPSGCTVVSRSQAKVPEMSLDLYFDENRQTAYVAYGFTGEMEAFRISPDNRISAIDAGSLPRPDLTSGYDGNVLFGCNGDGLTVAGKDGRREVYDTSCSDISGDVITAAFGDSDGNLWIGTYRYGLNLYSPRFGWISALQVKEGLSNRLATALAVSDSVLYVGTDGAGMDRIDLRTGRKTNFRKSAGGIAGDAVLSIIEDDGSLWLGCYSDGLSRFDLRTSTFRSYPFKGESIWCIADDGMDRIWIIGRNVTVFGKSTGEFSSIGGMQNVWGKGVRFVGDEAWVTTSDKGIYVIDMATMKVKSHHDVASGMPSDAIWFVYVDSHRNKWLGIHNDGLYMSRAGEPFEKARRVEGLGACNVMSVVEDRKGDMWVATDNGLFRYNSLKKSFARYGKEDGLSSVQFLSGSYAMDDDRIYFGTTQGVVEIRPEMMEYGSVKPIHINSLNLLHSGLIMPVAGKESAVKLPHGDNFFTICFSQPELVSPGKMAYSCRLDGFDKEWRDLGAAREATYTNVPPGHYIFEVRSLDWDGSWSDVQSGLEIVISSPWYVRWWAILLWCILSLGVVCGCVRVYAYKRQIKDRFREALRRVRESHPVRAIEIREMRAVSSAPDESRVMRDVIECIEKNISDSGYSIDALSRDVSVSRAKLYRIIQDETGRTPAMFIREIRLSQASRLLSTTQLNVSEISSMVGFGSMKYFNKYFKEKFGMTPTCYREENKENKEKTQNVDSDRDE